MAASMMNLGPLLRPPGNSGYDAGESQVVLPAKQHLMFALRDWELGLRACLPVEVGITEKFKSCWENAQICADTFSEAPPPKILCGNYAGAPRHEVGTISEQYFDAPAYVSHSFSGNSWNWPAHKFCTIFSDTWYVLSKFAFAQAWCLKAREQLRVTDYGQDET